jgi:glycosyltransferase involved in cell wall biosynthesis
MPTITTILPTYNRSDILPRAIDSVRTQTWSNISIVVRDNCSKDNTEALVSNIISNDSRVVYKKNAYNIGSIENIRHGIRKNKTEFFSILCDDDYLEPGFYMEAMRLFEKYPDAGFIAFRVDVVDCDGKFIYSCCKDYSGPIKSIYYSSEDGLKAYLRSDLPYNHTGYVFKADVAKSIDFGEYAEVGFGADIYFIWHAAARYNFVVTNYKAGNCTSHDQSTSSTLVNAFDERFLYWWRNRMLLIKNDPDVSVEIKNMISNYYLTHSTKSFNSFKHYTYAAVDLISNRIKKKEFDELKVDFIAMRSFLPWFLLIIIKFVLIGLVYFKIDTKLRSMLPFIRNILCIYVASKK